MTKVSTRVVALATMVGITLAAASTASAALNLPVQSCNYVFTANLKAGMRNAEVRNLQKVLNGYPQTMVAASGAGSVGMETDYFGAATKAAVIKFQNLHMSDVLTPAGLTAGNGNVFSLTRAMLNQICNGSTVPTTPTTPTTSGNVSVMLSANQPTNVLVAGQATARLADFSFTGNGTVTNVKLMRSGVSSNDTLSNVYLFDNGMRIAGPASVSTDGSINFGSTSGLFTVMGSKTLTVRSDIKAGVSGQSVGVTLVGYTVMGSSMATTNVMGTQLPVANVTLLTADFPTGNTASPALTSINAGTVNQTVWSRSLNVSTRIGKLHGLTLKMVGSAPTNSLANVRLIVDGTQVSSGMVDASGYVSFSLASAPLSLITGSHLIEVRGDIVGGANRTFYMVMEQASDIMVEDSQVAGAFVTVTTNSGSNAVNLAGGVVTVLTGTLTVTQDTSFSNSTNLIGGASNVKMAAFKFTSNGEDVKISTLSFMPAITGTTPANNNLANVGLYVNGGQVGSNQTATNGVALTFNNLGTNLLIQSGATVIVEIRGDVMSSTSTAYTAGNVAFNLQSGTNNVQGISSSNLTNSPTQSGQLLTIASTNVSFSSAVGFGASTKAPNTTVKIGSFSFQTGSAEGSVINNVAVTMAGTMIGASQLTNLTVKDGSNLVGTSINNPVNGVNNFSATINVPVNTTKVLDVYADFQAGASTYTATPSMQVTYRGATSNLSANTALVAGVTTTGGVGTIGTGQVTFVPGSSPVAQYVIAGTNNFAIGNFNVKSSNGIGSTVTKMTVTFPANTISGVSVNGGPVQSPTTATTAELTGLNILVPGDNSGINIPMTVNLICATTGVGSGCTGSSTAVVTAQITSLTYENGIGATVITPSAITASHVLVASKPTLAVTSMTSTGFGNGTMQIGTLTISADASGDLELKQIPVNTTVAGAGAITAGSVELRDSAGTAIITNTSGVNGGAQNIVFSTARTLTKGTSETFTVYATFTGVTGAAGTQSATFQLGAKANFLWNDVAGGSSNNTGTSIYGYPTNSQTKTN